MAKSKNIQTATPSQTGSNPAFKRIGNVTLPTLKITEGTPAFVLITGPIEEKPKADVQKDGTTLMKTISVMPIVNLETGEVMSMVPGKALEQNLKDYKGGNLQYVGLCFEVTKHPAAPGKKWKPWSIFEIEKPANV